MPRSLIAPDVFLATCGSDDEILSMMVAGLALHSPRELAAVRAALACGDLPSARESAHKLRGILAAFSELAGDEAQRLEDHAQRHEGAQAAATLARLEPLLDALLGELATVSVASLEARG